MKKKSSINSKGVIAISHQKGGVGKSTLIWNLITQYSKNEIVDVIDLDVQQTVTYSLAIRKKHNLAVNNINLLNIRDSKDKKSDELLLIVMNFTYFHKCLWNVVDFHNVIISLLLY